MRRNKTLSAAELPSDEESGRLKTQYIKDLWMKQPDLTPKQVQAALADQELQVSLPMIYKVQRQIRQESAINTAPTLEELQELKRVAVRFGGFNRLRVMCEMLQNLQVHTQFAKDHSS